jgi:hypothetical protein
MKRVAACLAAGLALMACQEAETPTGAQLLIAMEPSLAETPACRSVSGILALRFAGSDGTQLFFEGDFHGALEGTFFGAVVVDPPTASLPHVVHVSGTNEWTIDDSEVPELVGRRLVFAVSGQAPVVGPDRIFAGRGFHGTLVEGARSGNMVNQTLEPEPGGSGSGPYHGEICP